MPISISQLPGILSNATGLGEAGIKAGAQARQSDTEAALRKYLQAQEPEITGQKQAQQNQANLNTLKSPEFQDELNRGGSAKAGDLAVGADPMARLTLVADRGEEAARQKAIQNYNRALPKLQSTFQAANEGLDFVNDPKNPGSMGQARTLALKAMGMNRYNEKEAEAVVPPALRGTLSQLFNQAGGDMNPLNESQRAALNQFFQSQLHQTKQQHDMLKQGSLDTYNMSRYAAPSGQQRLQGVMGGSFDKSLGDAEQRYKQVPKTEGPNLTPTPNPGPLDQLMSYFGKGPSAVQPPQPGPHGDSVVQDGVTYKWNPQTKNYE